MADNFTQAAIVASIKHIERKNSDKKKQVRFLDEDCKRSHDSIEPEAPKKEKIKVLNSIREIDDDFEDSDCESCTKDVPIKSHYCSGKSVLKIFKRCHGQVKERKLSKGNAMRSKQLLKQVVNEVKAMRRGRVYLREDDPNIYTDQIWDVKYQK